MTADRVKPLPDTQRPSFAVRALRELWRLFIDSPFRHVTLLRLMHPKGAFQPFNDTRTDRYPRIFGFVQSQLGAASESKILSYGCSTGEEVFSLRSYFPGAAIKGIDINPGNIAICRRRLKQIRDAAISFELSDSMRAEPAAAYDAIFCMAVLRHGSLGLPGVTRCDPLLQFEDFARMVEDFARCLKPGGLLIIRHSNFRLCDTPIAGDFETIMSVPLGAATQKTPLFGADNQLLRGVEYPDTVFRKK
jgi:SAM-dependent methyltransferase